ncbi:MAG: hypothetical protein KC476_09500 [Cyanobacteria bacterium HKST-UBA06]|nr:hypothetical protein [Cyanobacteria bacterium HKST-UBA04]MCA9808175.1 hypothetical protein [Cyanobacteria bacterium HKST-UBA06]
MVDFNQAGQKNPLTLNLNSASAQRAKSFVGNKDNQVGFAALAGFGGNNQGGGGDFTKFNNVG